MEYSIAIEIYVGRKLNMPEDVSLIQRPNGTIEIEEWNISDIQQPSMELLELLSDKVDLVLAQEKIIADCNDMMDKVYEKGTYDTFGFDIATIRIAAENMIKELING